MNLFETIYCSQSYEMKKAGSDPMRGRLVGTLLITAIIVIATAVLLVLYSKVAPHNPLANFFNHTLGGQFMPRSTSKLLALGGMIIVGGTLYYTYAGKEKYEQMIKAWEQLPEAALEDSRKKTIRICIVSFSCILLGVVVCLLL